MPANAHPGRPPILAVRPGSVEVPDASVDDAAPLPAVALEAAVSPEAAAVRLVAAPSERR